MQQLFREAPRASFQEADLALAAHGRLGRDANGRALQAEAHALLDRCGVADEDVREFWLDLWAAADSEAAAVHAEEMKAMAER